ncbi:MAG TPA: hypothetical protein VF209_00620 [Patescibacteria group bacterium]
MTLVKLLLSTVLALSLLSGMVTPVLADGTEPEEECEKVTVTRVITESGAYGQQTQREVEEERCKIEVADLPNAGLDPITAVAVASVVTVGVGAFALSKKIA